MRSWRRVLGLTMIGGFCLLPAVLAMVQIQQRLARWQAQSLHADIMPLMLKPGNFADLQRLQKRWGAHARYEGGCTAAHCVYQIVLGMPGGSVLKLPAAMLPYVYAAFSYLGGREASVMAEVSVHDGVIWQVRFLAVVALSERGETGLFPLNGEIVAGPHLGWLSDSLEDPALDRGYESGRPDACTVCVMGWNRVTFQAPARDVQRLTRVNFDCWTQWNPCVTQTDLLPGWDGDRTSNDEETGPCPSIQVRAREAEKIVLARVTDTSFRDDPERTEIVTVEPDVHVKPLQSRATAGTMTFVVEQALRTRVIPGGQYFFLYRSPSGPEPKEQFESTGCSVIENSAGNATAVRQGVALDGSRGEPDSSDISTFR